MNQNSEQLARDEIDRQLFACGWVIQDEESFNLAAGLGVAIREFQTSEGPADYVLFVSGKRVGLIKAKLQENGVRLTMVEDQSTEYASAKLKYINSNPLPVGYESTGEFTRFTDYGDPKLRSQPVFSVYRPQGFELWPREIKTLKTSLHNGIAFFL